MVFNYFILHVIENNIDIHFRINAGM